MPSISEDEDDNLVLLSGAFANLINGTGISDKIDISIKDSEGDPAAVTQEYLIEPEANGRFQTMLETKGLRSGIYEINVQPKSKPYNDLVSTANISINPHAMTVEEFGVYIGIAATIIGVIEFLPQMRNYSTGKKHRRNMAGQMDEVNDIYDRVFSTDSQRLDLHEVIQGLIQKRDTVLKMFRNNQIDQEQYGLLDGKISEYLDKLPKDT